MQQQQQQQLTPVKIVLPFDTKHTPSQDSKALAPVLDYQPQLELRENICIFRWFHDTLA